MGMHVRGGSQWKQQRREENSIGPLRRAHPASGATWNVQVVRGKMSTQCLWHACRALMVGILLMVIGASMATIGYYSNDFATGELRNNSTVRVKNEQRGLHLNNLSYMGPIVMGVGGFIVVASCVMTFEARDSAAKVVPARFKLSTGARSRSGGTGSRRTTSVQSSDSRKTSACQSGRWEQHLGLFKSSPGSDLPPDRHALTAALIHFSRTLGSPKCAPTASSSSQARRISKSDSVPNLLDNGSASSPLLKASCGRRILKHRHLGKHSSLLNRTTRENGLLYPGAMRLHRHAISVDETGPLRQDSAHGSQASVTFDPTPEIIDIVPVHKKRERNKRSDTSRKHVLSRQKPIEKEEQNSPKAGTLHQRRSSTISDNSFSSRRAERSRRASASSRSFDSRYQNPSVSSTMEINDLLPSPEKRQSPRKACSILSTPSMEREFRSQLSICSEPTVAIKQLSCQSSIEPCVLEEDILEMDDKDWKDMEHGTQESTVVTIENDHPHHKMPRPDSLILNTTTIVDPKVVSETKKYLYRSQSTKCSRKPKLKASKVLSNDLDQIYVISSNSCMRADLNDFYDSIDVIHERRSKNFSKFTETDDSNDKEVSREASKNENIIETTVDIESQRN